MKKSLQRGRAAALFIFLLVLQSFLPGCTRTAPDSSFSSSSSSGSGSSSAKNRESSSSLPETEETEGEKHSQVRFAAVGDNLIHDTIYQQASERSIAAGEPRGYDFMPAYEEIAPVMESADVAFINQETLLASEIYPPSSYPMFNSPTQLGDLMVDLGFNLVSHANNHVLDKGVDGILATLDYWDTKEDVAVAGVYRSEEDRDQIRILEKNGITFALVAFTEHTNGLKLREDSQLQIIYTHDQERIQQQIQKARKEADVVVAAVHWGTEGSHLVTEGQKALAQQMADWGADLILGHHPHVLQPIEYIDRADGGRSLVIYSLGNFISAQSYGPNLIAGILELEIDKNLETGEIQFSAPSFLPIVTHYEGRAYRNLKLYLVRDYNSTLAAAHGVLSNTPAFSMEYIGQTLYDNIGEEYLDPATVQAIEQAKQNREAQEENSER